MVHNEQLLEMLTEVFRQINEANKGSSSNMNKIKVVVDEPERIVIVVGPLLVHGFDFRKGKDTKQRYFNSIVKIKLSDQMSNKKRFLFSGTIAEGSLHEKDIMGWYATK